MSSGKAVLNDDLLKAFWRNKVDQNNQGEREAEARWERHIQSQDATIHFHKNRNALHTYRHEGAVDRRERAAREKRERFAAEQDRKTKQANDFIERELSIKFNFKYL